MGIGVIATLSLLQTVLPRTFAFRILWEGFILSIHLSVLGKADFLDHTISHLQLSEGMWNCFPQHLGNVIFAFPQHCVVSRSHTCLCLLGGKWCLMVVSIWVHLNDERYRESLQCMLTLCLVSLQECLFRCFALLSTRMVFCCWAVGILYISYGY